MSDQKLPPSPGLPPERSRTVAPSVGGTPPPQPRQPTTPPRGVHPVSQSDADVSHGRPAAPKMGEGGAPKEEGGMIRFDWYPNSVAQIVSLNKGESRVESIMGRVIKAGTDPGPTSLTFRKVKRGDAMTTGRALHTGSINLVGNVLSDPADIDQIMAMTAEEADLNLDDGDCIVADFSGNMANARGTVMIKVSER